MLQPYSAIFLGVPEYALSVVPHTCTKHAPCCHSTQIATLHRHCTTSQATGTTHWLPLVLRPALAMLSTPVAWGMAKDSSENLRP
jgi:hypothetical protein